MSVHVIGDSHLGSLTKAYARDEERFRTILREDVEFFMLGTANDFYKNFFIENSDRLAITVEGAAERAERFQSGRPEIAFPNGSTFLVSAGLHTSTILSGQTWVQHAPWWTSALNKRARLTAMSDAVFQTITVDAHQHVLAFLSALRRRTSEVYVLAPPPPTKRFALLRLGYESEDVLRMDAAMRSVMRDEIAKLDIEVIDPPSTVTADGFLASHFLQPKKTDPHHGNIEYATIALANALDHIRSRRQTPRRNLA